MKKSLKLLFLSFLTFFCAANFNPSFASALTYSSTEAFCALIGDGCSVVSETEVSLNSLETIVLGEADASIALDFEDLTINFYSPVELKGELDLKGNYVFNDFNETSSPTIPASFDDGNLFYVRGTLTLNNLSLESSGDAVAFQSAYGSTLTINGGSYKAKTLIVSGSDQEIIINGGNFEADYYVFNDLSRSKSVLISDGNFKSNLGSVMPVMTDMNNVKIVSGTFEASKENSDAEIFKILGSKTEDSSSQTIKNLLSPTSEIYDLENETSVLTYRNEFIDGKGETDFGFLNTKKIVVLETGGRGDDSEEPEEEPEEPEVPAEEEETEENPDTLIDHPILYFSGITLATCFGFLSLKKYLDL